MCQPSYLKIVLTAPDFNYFTRKTTVLVGSEFNFSKTVKWLHRVVEIIILFSENHHQQNNTHQAQSVLLIDSLGKYLLCSVCTNLYFLYWRFCNKNIQFLTPWIYSHHSNFLRLTSSLKDQNTYKARVGDTGLQFWLFTKLRQGDCKTRDCMGPVLR